MSDIFLFIVSFIVSIRTLSYGFSTLSEKNISGSVLVFFMSALLFALAVYLLILDRT